MKKVFTASLATETNSFSPIITGENSFRTAVYYPAGTAPRDELMAFAAPLYVLHRRAAEEGWSVVQGLVTFAQPGGITPKKVYEALRDQLLQDLTDALPVDMVALGLHGGMIADGYDDCEGDLLCQVRGIVGPDVPVGALLDPHCHLSPQMVENSDILICFKENPHTDYLERAEELITLLTAAMAGRIQPVQVLYDCGMFDFLNTRLPAMRTIVDRAIELEKSPSVLSISIAHGFARGDVPDMGTKLLVITENDAELGASIAADMADRLWAARGKSRPEFVPMEQAIDKALVPGEGPVVLADAADNPGGGAPSDTMHIVRALLNRGMDDFAVALVWDPQAVSFAREAGEGAKLSLRMGGKACAHSGLPLDLNVTVDRIVTGAYQTLGLAKAPLGTVVAVRSGRCDIVLTDLRNQVFTPHVFTEVGIDPWQKKVLIVKSGQHFRTAFEPKARDIIVVSAPGVCNLDIVGFPYRKIGRPKWPFDAERATPHVAAISGRSTR